MAPIPTEIAELLRFASNKLSVMGTSTSLREICVLFKAETGSLFEVGKLSGWISAYRRRIHEIKEFDVDTKARMMMALKAPVDDAFLIELKKYANVEVNDFNQILRYEYRMGVNDDGDGSTEIRRSRRFADKRRLLIGRTEERNDYEEASSSTTPKNKKSRASKSVTPTPQPSKGHLKANSRKVDNKTDDLKPLRSNEQPKNMGGDPDFEIIEEKPTRLITLRPETSPERDSTSVKELLVLLRSAVMSVKSPSLVNLQAKVEGKLRRLTDQKMPLKNINASFDACLFMLMRFAQPKSAPDEESTSLRDFLISLKFVTCHISHPSFDSFHQKLEAIIFDLSARDKRLPIKIVDSAIEATLLMIDP